MNLFLNPEVRVNQDLTDKRQIECQVAANPMNSLNIVVVGMDHRNDPTNAVQPSVFAYTTLNAGTAWSEHSFPAPFTTPPSCPPGGTLKAADPSVAFGSQNRVYAVVNWLHDWPGITGWPKFGGVYVHRSTDGGITWGPAVAVDPIQYTCPWPVATASVLSEKPMIAVGPGGAGNGNDLIYVAWTRQYRHQGGCPPDYTDVYFSRSTDSGQSFLATPVQVSAPQGSRPSGLQIQWQAVPAVGPGNTVYVVWLDVAPLPPPDGIGACRADILIRRSNDQGTNWGSIVMAVPGIYATWGSGQIWRCVPPPQASPFYYYPNIATVGRGWTHPCVKTWGENVYIVWHDTNAHPCPQTGVPPLPVPGRTEIRLAVSNDGGLTFPTILSPINNDGGSTNQFFPWMDVGPTGDLLIAWYDSRNDPIGNTLNDVYFTVLSQLNYNCQLTSVSSLPTLLVDGAGLPYTHIGEYLGVSSSLDRTWVVGWVDCRNARPFGDVNDRSADIYLRQLYPMDIESSVVVIRLGPGGTAVLRFDAGRPHAGRRYRVLGSSGRETGFRLQDRWIPLDTDPFFSLVEAERNGPVCQDFEGVLDANGATVARIVLLPGGVFPTGTFHFALLTSEGACVTSSRSLRIEP